MIYSRRISMRSTLTTTSDLPTVTQRNHKKRPPKISTKMSHPFCPALNFRRRFNRTAQAAVSSVLVPFHHPSSPLPSHP
ncbi:Uncharacterized protein HZ326_10760 [Fusarium oxysporum f. sp. albedinis]|nr:Uncharacterized protein HZ326_10760 [Fusarium oxysporum f. sp. albedinis]